jgi:hypothetical protein
MSGVAPVSASPVTSAITNELPTDAQTGRCAFVSTSLVFRPTQAATSSTGISGPSDSGCGAAMVIVSPTSISTRPAISSKRSLPSLARPCFASTQPVPTLGWPANGISARRLKMRTRAVFAGSAGGSTKVVSLRLNSDASACISASLMPRASGNTASGLPPKRFSVNTSTVTKEKRGMGRF